MDPPPATFRSSPCHKQCIMDQIMALTKRNRRRIWRTASKKGKEVRRFLEHGVKQCQSQWHLVLRNIPQETRNTRRNLLAWPTCCNGHRTGPAPNQSGRWAMDWLVVLLR